MATKDLTKPSTVNQNLNLDKPENTRLRNILINNLRVKHVVIEGVTVWTYACSWREQRMEARKRVVELALSEFGEHRYTETLIRKKAMKSVSARIRAVKLKEEAAMSGVHR